MRQVKLNNRSFTPGLGNDKQGFRFLQINYPKRRIKLLDWNNTSAAYLTFALSVDGQVKGFMDKNTISNIIIFCFGRLLLVTGIIDLLILVLHILIDQQSMFSRFCLYVVFGNHKYFKKQTKNICHQWHEEMNVLKNITRSNRILPISS